MARAQARAFVAVLLIPVLAPISRTCQGQEAGGTLGSALQPYVDRHVLAGAVVLVADRERTLATETAGFADIASGKAMRPDALFWIASQTKPITAAALMILVDEGKVKLDEPVATYIPAFRDCWLMVEQDQEHQLLRRPARPVTVRDLLRHTSGLPFRSALEEPTLDMLPLRDAAQSYAITPLQFGPGTRYQYSNAGINTAGRIIEVVSGRSYEDFLDERLFRPLGMTDTTFWPNPEQLARLATSYKPDAAKTVLEATTVTQLTYPLNDRRRQPMPAGGLFSTAADLARFCRMVLNNGVLDGRRILSESAVAEMTKRQTDESIKESYGLGWSVGGGTYGHGGAYSTNMTVDPGKNLVLIFLVQHAGYPGDGGKSQEAFVKAARERYARPAP